MANKYGNFCGGCYYNEEHPKKRCKNCRPSHFINKLLFKPKNEYKSNIRRLEEKDFIHLKEKPKDSKLGIFRIKSLEEISKEIKKHKKEVDKK